MHKVDIFRDCVEVGAAFSEGVGIGNYILDWPANSPDPNPFATVWNLIKDRLHRRTTRSTSKADICRAIQEVWESITALEIGDIVASMPE